MRLAIHGQEVEVPAVIGMAPYEAERTLAAVGLQMDVERQYYSPRIPEGRIMMQLPLPETKVRRGWQVRVAQSMGPQRVSIPDVTGQSERAAEINIQRRGLELSSIAEIQIFGIPPDQVLAQNPPANASQVEAPRTSLLISSSPQAGEYVMPNFAGQPLGAVTKELQDAGFKLGSVSVAPPANPSSNTPGQTPVSTIPVPAPQPGGGSIIVSQSPPAGQKVEAGAVVNFEIR